MTRIPCVEDNDDSIGMLKLRFELLDGFELLIADNGETGFATLPQNADKNTAIE